jgi:multisubunit Na+/H+ antiporter MnhB subunit
MVRKFVTLLWVGALGAATGWVVWQLPDEPRGLTALVGANMEASGVEHPVTGVLLNFRSYDTWLELGVLFLAMIGVLCLQRLNDLSSMKLASPPGAVLEWLVRWLIPLLVLASGYLLWLGKFASGGAFQAGVVLGAAGVLLWLSGHRSASALEGGWWRVVLLLGFGVFYLAAAVSWLAGKQMLEYPPLWAGTLILVIETAAAISIGLVLASLFIGLQPLRSAASGPGLEAPHG